MILNKLGEVLGLLNRLGFTTIQNRGNKRSFEGELNCKKGAIQIRLDISDWDFVSYPAITVLDHGKTLPQLAPHVDEHGHLCYFEKGRVILDRYDPAQAVEQCLSQAKSVLESIRNDTEYRDKDIQNEFLIHWLRDQAKEVWPVLFGTTSKSSMYSNYWILKKVGFCLISELTDEAAGIAKSFGVDSPVKSACKCWIFHTEKLPPVPVRMPSNLHELFHWLREWDRSLYNEINKVLGMETSYLEFTFATFAIDTPLGWIGFGFDHHLVHRLASKNNPKIYRQYLHNHGNDFAIFRMQIYEVGPDYVHGRNLMYSTLKDKRIILVGCGAIGSQIAPGLVRLGAGTGKGSLELVDPDVLGSENLGRHFLGYPSLLKSKAKELAKEISRQFPMSKLIPTEQNVCDHNKLFDADLVIDATGEEAVSEMINAWRINAKTRVPVLHLRIRGNGECVQSFWAQGDKLACFRCLLDPQHKDKRKERHEVLKDNTVRKRVGCRGFTPYAINSPISAAALGLEVIVDWLERGDPSPRFRTRSTSNANVRKVADINVSKQRKCQACDPIDD